METISALLALCAGNSPATDEFPSQRPVTWSFDVFFDLHLNKCLSKQSWGFDLRCHCAYFDVIVMMSHCQIYYFVMAACSRMQFLLIFLQSLEWFSSMGWPFLKSSERQISTFNTLKWIQNGCNFADDTFKYTEWDLEFQLNFHLSLFLRVQLTIFQLWFR